MIRFNMKNLKTKARNLTQEGRLNQKCVLSDTIRAVIFTRTLYAAPQRESIVELGVGNLDPIAYTRILMQYAFEQGVSLATVVTEFQTYLGTIVHSRNIATQIAGYITGSNTRIIQADKLAGVYGDNIIEQVRIITKPPHDIFVYIVADYIMQSLGATGLIITGSPYSWKLASVDRYLDYPDLVNVVAAARLAHILTGLAAARSESLATQIREKRVVNPIVLGTYIEEGLMTAFDRASHSYDPERVTIASLLTLAKTWDPRLISASALGARVANSAPLEELKVNLGLFMVYQDMIARQQAGEPINLQITYSDEEMANEILPFFKSALNEVSLHRAVPVSDVTSSVSMASVRRHDGFPGHQILFEDWDVSADAVAFVPARISAKNPARYLDIDLNVTEKLTTGMKPIVKAMDMRSLAASRLASYELQFPGDIGRNGCEMTIALPSMVERLVSGGTGLADFNPALEKMTDATTRDVRKAIYQSYVHLVHLAVNKAPRTVISPIGQAVADGDAAAMHQLAIAFAMPATFNEVIGEAAILDREIVTFEPIEAIAYARDFRSTSVLKAESFRVTDFERRLHVWDWQSAAKGLKYNSVFVMAVRGRSYTTTIDESRLLGEDSARPRLFYIGSRMARVLAESWANWLVEDHKYLKLQAKSAKDKVEQRMYEGAAEALAMEIASTFAIIGGAGFGASIARSIDSSLRNQMVGTPFSDDRSDIKAGVQRVGIQFGAASIALEFLGLLNVVETAALRKIVTDSNALSIVATTQFNLMRENMVN